jgi:HEAT repeat protein
MMKRWFLPALALLAILLLVEWYSGSTEKDSRLTSQSDSKLELLPVTMQWRDGQAQQYKVLSDSSMQMQAAAQGASSIRVQLQALLDTLVLKANSDEVLLGMRLSSVELKINDIVDTETNRALSEPFRVRIATNGMPLAFEFPADVNQQNRIILENLVRTFQVSLDNVDDWVENETNGSGTYEAVYKRTGPTRFEKSKRKFIAAAEGMLNWSEVSSTESFSIEAGHNWITEMDIRETMTSEGQGGPSMSVDNYATLKLQPGIQLTLSPDLWRFDAVAAVKATTAGTKNVPDLTPEQARQQILTTLPELDAATQGRLGLIHRLRDLLLVDDAMPAVILNALKTQELEDRTRADLYLALELAGSDSAQAALVEVITDDSWSVRDGMRAIVAMGGIKQPTSESITALWDMTQYNAGDERQRMANSATFALGSIGNSLNKADDPEYSTLRSNLLSNAFSGGDVSQRSNYIRALGNTHDTTLADEVVVLLDDPDPSIRRATALSLGTLGTDQVADRLVSQYRSEDNGYVRSAIAESLESWSNPTESAMTTFRQNVLTEKDESTRYNIARILGNNLEKFPENETVLREIMRSEPSKRIRQSVAELLTVHNEPGE